MGLCFSARGESQGQDTHSGNGAVQRSRLRPIRFDKLWTGLRAQNAAFLKAEIKRWSKVVKQAGIEAQ